MMKHLKTHQIEPIRAVNNRQFSLPNWLERLKQETQVTIDHQQAITIRFNELEECQDSMLGSGMFGTVKKMKHKPSGQVFAVKVKNSFLFSDN